MRIYYLLIDVETRVNYNLVKKIEKIYGVNNRNFLKIGFCGDFLFFINF